MTDPLGQLASQLLAQEAWTEAVAAASQAGLVAVSAEGRIEWINPLGATLGSRTPEECIGQPVKQLIPAFPRSGDAVANIGGAPPEAFEAWVARKDRVAVPIRLSVVRILRSGEELFVGGFHSIGRQLETEQQLRESEGRFGTLVQRAPDGLLVVQDGRIVFGNPALGELLGDVEGRAVAEMFHARVREDLFQWIRRAGWGETVRTVESPTLHSSGEERFADTVWVRIEFEGRPAVLGILRDATEVRGMRVQLAQSDRLASLGVLAAGVAHEVNNPLTYVLSNLVDIQEASADPDGGALDRDEIRRHAAQALDGARRIRRIAKGLTTFARVDAGEAEAVAVVSVLEDAMRLADSEIRRRAQVIPRIHEVPPVRGTPGQLAQVFLNLLLNAAQAIEPGDRSNHSITVRVEAVDDEVHVSITDTGSGIAPADIARLFEPFFTTKPRGVGSGLGLSICQRIVGDLGGRIEVESVLGEGTTMTVALLAEDPSALTPDPSPPPDAARAGRLMVVDDDAAVLDSLKRLLEAGGHEVVALGSGESALRLLAEDDRFDLILTDLMMDGMSGIDLYEALARDRPALAEKLTFVSGGAFDQPTRDFLARIPNPQLSKPFELDSLLSFVSEHLAARRRAPIGSP